MGETLVPTRVGMILTNGELNYKIDACPHTRGDDPRKMLQYIKAKTCPHTRGDDPIGDSVTPEPVILSPHAWG